ncbi:uncharacterized protein DAT39_012308, partial [Clarias magur]
YWECIHPELVTAGDLLPPPNPRIAALSTNLTKSVRTNHRSPWKSTTVVLLL